MASTVAEAYQPRPVQLGGFASIDSIEAAEAELHARAEADPNKCWGYFPGMKDRCGIANDLPVCAQFAEQNSTVELAGFHLPLGFNFLRMSVTQQEATDFYHIDSDASTALTGDLTDINERLVWRLLLNLNPKTERNLSYLAIDPSTLELSFGDGFIHYPARPSQADIRSIEIPARKDDHVSGVLFCANRILHSGKDDEAGHFVASYGVEEIVL